MRTEIISEDLISESIRIMLAYKNMSGAQLAEIIKMNIDTYYSKIRRGNFSIKELDKISAALDATYYFVLTPNNDEQSASNKQDEQIKVRPENLSEAIRVLCVKKKTNTIPLAKAAGMSSSSLYAKLKRNVFSVEDITVLARALGYKSKISFELNLI